MVVVVANEACRTTPGREENQSVFVFGFLSVFVFGFPSVFVFSLVFEYLVVGNDACREEKPFPTVINFPLG